MYEEAALLYLYPYFQSFNQEVESVQSFEELCGIQKPNGVLNNLTPTSNELEYNLPGEGDLFRAPEATTEEPVVSCDPVSSAISLIYCGEDVIFPKVINVADIRSMQNNSLLSEVFYESKDLSNFSMKESFSEVDVKVPAIQMEDDLNLEKSSINCQGSIHTSASSGCLSSLEWVPSSSAVRPNFFDFQGVDFETADETRRAYSEGDMQTSSNGNVYLDHSPPERTINTRNNAIEERLQKLSRYRKKKCKRNFGRTIKYACRKALAESQPRVRGRFARTEELEISKKQLVISD